MDSEKTFLRIAKFIVIIACVLGIILRLQILDEYANIYMAVVNISSFFVALNLWLYDFYSKLRRKYREAKINVIRKTRFLKTVMLVYILIFIINIVLAFIIFLFYVSPSSELAVSNDILGILSLGFAISTDFLSDFMVNIILYFLEKIQ